MFLVVEMKPDNSIILLTLISKYTFSFSDISVSYKEPNLHQTHDLSFVFGVGFLSNCRDLETEDGYIADKKDRGLLSEQSLHF